MLQTSNLTIGYRPHTVIAADLDLNLNRGQLICLLGPNGAGKSTLMRTLAGMQPPLHGRVLLDNEPIADLSPQQLACCMSIVLTERVNVGLMSGYALVALGRYPYTDWRGRLSDADHAIVQDAITAVGAQSLAHRPVSELSDGERQKIMIGRALAQEPDVIMLDEPTAFLDLPRRVEIMQILRRLAHEDGRAILLSTHDLDLALRSADTIWLMTDQQLHIGTPEELVINGVFAHAFASEGVTFDPTNGAFRVSQTERGVITVADACQDAVRVIWTARALERLGYRVAENAETRVTCYPDRWHYANINYRSLSDLLEAL